MLARSIGSATPARAAVVVAAIATVVLAVGMDLFAGEHPVHTATIGMIALVVAVMRIRCVGSHRGYLASLSGAIVAQPALHAASKLFPSAPADPVGNDVVGHVAESSVSLAHVLLAAVVVAFVTGAERLFSALVTVCPLARLLLLLVRPSPPTGPVSATWPVRATPLVRALLVADVSLRGPPRRSLAAV